MAYICSVKENAPAVVVADIQAQYGLSAGTDLLTLVSAVREGVPYRLFDRLVKSKLFSIAHWAHLLHVSERTLLRYQKAGHTFDAVQSERILQIVMLYAYGVEVFGQEHAFQRWLESESIALGGRIPQDLLDSAFGIELLRDELGRIEHGVLA